MKSILFICLFITSSVFSQTITLKKVIDYDLDSEIESLNMVSKSSSWKNVYSNDFKIPKDLTDYELVHEIIDYDQVVYQSCNGEIWDKSRINSYINRWGLDTASCSPRFINSFVNGVIGKFNGIDSYILDENNNFDLTDDEIYNVTDSINQVHKIVFERFINNKIALDTVTIKVLSSKFDKKGDLKGLKYKYCEYRTGDLHINGERVKINLYPGRWYLYHKESKLDINGLQNIPNNHFFQIDNKYYRVSSIDKKGYKVSFEKYQGNDKPTSCQVDFPAPDFRLNDTLSLSDLKGKYIYLYIWNIDCSACEYGLPKYFKKYSDSKYKNIEFILVSVDQPEASIEFLAKHGIKWTNLKTLGNSMIYNDYGVSHFPTDYLIDPNGIIMKAGQCIYELDKIVD